MQKKKRIFIKYLQESVSPSEIETAFSDYGKVSNVDIKERKSFDSTCHQSKYFAYVHMEIEDYKLQQCFEDFYNGLWKGQRIELQLAKENILDQLKREREESNQINSNKDEKSDKNLERKFDEIATFNIIKDETALEKKHSKVKLHQHTEKIDIPNKRKVSETFQQSINTEIKASDFLFNEDREQNNVNLTPSEIKRSHSVNKMIKGYREQKLIIKTALSNVDSKPNNKIKFSDNDDNLVPSTDKFESFQKNKDDKNTLFESDEESDNDLDCFNFEVKETFKGNEGKKLFELQSTYKNDKRFVLDKRFINDEKENVSEDNENLKAFETNTSEEKEKQFEILEQILGSKVKVKPTQHSSQQGQTKKRMLRFDPTQYDHSKYELKVSKSITKTCKIPKQKLVDKESKPDEAQQPLVSKDVFYRVSEELKETFLEPQSFSLLSTFGKSESVENNHDEEAEELIETKKSNMLLEDNPFRYDSSDDERNEDLEERDDKNSEDKVENNQKNVKMVWSEPFFFKDDDFRLQEGLDFMKRIASEKNYEFMQLRRDLKNVVKAKIRNNQRKNKPFKKKLGGNKRKKMIRIKKALKR